MPCARCTTPLVDCFALRLGRADRAVVMSGDTAYLPPALADLAKGADLLVHEAMLAAALPGAGRPGWQW